MKCQCANGWTKEKVLARFKERNNNTPCYCEIGKNCLYKDDKGNHCAIGAFIPEGHPAFKCSCDVLELLDRYPDLKPYMPFSDIYVLKDFQELHDNVGNYLRTSLYEAVAMWLEAKVE